MVRWLEDRGLPLQPSDFPPLTEALVDPDGLLAGGANLLPGTLVSAYHRGIFPWFGHDQPILWWSPDPRMVLPVHEFRMHRSLRKKIAMLRRDGRLSVRCDTACPEVILSCARTPRPGQDGTWIVPEMCEAYAQLHRMGVVHSLETWIDGELAAGLYGVALGAMFFGESMFTRVSDGSSVALAALVAVVGSGGGRIIDCQQQTAHLQRMGARPIPRQDFLAQSLELQELQGPAWTRGELDWAWVDWHRPAPGAP